MTHGVWHVSTNEYIHSLWWQPCKLYLSTWPVYQEQSDLCLHSNMYFGFLVEDTLCCSHTVCQIRGMCVKSFSSLFPETQTKALKHVSPSKQLCLAGRASWQLCCCRGLHYSSRKNSSFWDSNPVPKRRLRADYPLSQPDNTGKISASHTRLVICPLHCRFALAPPVPQHLWEYKTQTLSLISWHNTALIWFSC